ATNPRAVNVITDWSPGRVGSRRRGYCLSRSSCLMVGVVSRFAGSRSGKRSPLPPVTLVSGFFLSRLPRLQLNAAEQGADARCFARTAGGGWPPRCADLGVTRATDAQQT